MALLIWGLLRGKRIKVAGAMADTVHTMAEDSEREDPRAKADREETALFNSFI